MKLPDKSSGFTLIEVLISGVILIVAVSAMTFIYRTATISSLNASKSVTTSGKIDLVLATIQNKIRGSNANISLSGSGNINGLIYSWQSILLDNKAAPAIENIDNGDLSEQQKRFYLWQVNLIIEGEGPSKSFKYKEVSWTNI